MAELEEISAKITLDSNDFTAGMQKMLTSVNEFGAAIGVGLGISAFVEFGKAVVEAASQSQQAEILFAAALGSVGVRFDMVSASAEAYFQHLQDITGFQRDELQSSTTRLIQMTQNYADSLKL